MNLGSKSKFAIPDTINLMMVVVCSSLSFAFILLASDQANWAGVFIFAAAFSIIQIPLYTLIHEAEHNILNSNRYINDLVGRLLCCMFIAPFSFIKHCHLRHHKKNRTDMEMWDLYYEHQDKRKRYRSLYILMLTGHLSLVLSVILFSIWPKIVYSRLFTQREETAAFLKGSETKEKMRIFRLESLSVILFQSLLFIVFKIHWVPWLACYLLHSFVWSTQNYVAHAFSPRDIINGAHNLKLPHPLRFVYLNFNLHLAHHQNPKIPWIYLPGFIKDENYRISYFRNYLRLWKGPVLTHEPDPSKKTGIKGKGSENSKIREHEQRIA